MYNAEQEPLLCLGKASTFPGKPIVIFNFDAGYTSNSNGEDVEDFIFKSKDLAKILKHKDVETRNIAVVSIIGAFRKGKSFVMDYFLRYMYATVSLLSFDELKNTRFIFLVQISGQSDGTIKSES